jgi:diguanylate cyclase (GGDEF)-like protein
VLGPGANQHEVDEGYNRICSASSIAPSLLVMNLRRYRFLWLAAPAVQMAYFAAFPLLATFLGRVTVALPDIAIVGAAWVFGMRAATVTAAFAVIANMQMYQADGESATSAFVAGLAVAGISLAVAWIVDRLQKDKERIERLTLFDAMTQLPNREVFVRRLERLFVTGVRAQIALIDVAGFRVLNESFGHEVGNEVVREIARRLSATFGHALVAHIGTDDFAVLTDVIGTDEILAGRALEVFRAPFLVGGSLLQVEGRVGIAHSPEHGDTSATLMSSAQSASRAARRLAVGWATASETHSRDAAARLQTLNELRHALDRNELRLHYQPLLEVTSGKVVGFEALMRWQRDGVLVSPTQFIPLAEQTGLIVPLTDWVVGEAMRQSAEWAKVGHPVNISVNVGAKTIGATSHLETVITAALAQYGVPASRLTIEVTETDVMSDPVQSSRALASIKKLGVRVAVDDFGTGYSSLSYLDQLPLDEVKIDRSFINRLLSDPQTSSIVRAAVDLSHALGLDAVAEGVEDAATLERLTLLGCDRAQGYFIAKPMPADAVLPWLARHVSTPIGVDAPLAQLSVPAPLQTAGATVLVVDDEHVLRVATHRILAAQGFKILHAATASEALRICTEQRGEIDLVVTDIFLTDWRGHELAGRVHEMHPDIKFLFVSGDPTAGDLVKDAPFLAKPFSKQQLIDSVGSVLLGAA